MPRKVKHIFISAGEVSGDLNAANLVRFLKGRLKQVEFCGLGGPEMARAGVQIEQNIVTRSSVGIFEGIRFLRHNLATLRRLKKRLKTAPPDLLILVDNQGFNLNVAKAARARGIPTLYYFPPPVWIWGRHNAAVLAKTCDRVLCPFPDDVPIYQNAGAKTVFTGHPFSVDVTPRRLPVKAPRTWKIAIMPGSRRQEIDNLSVPLRDAMKLLNKSFRCRFFLPVANPEYGPMLEETFRGADLPLEFLDSPSHAFMKQCDLVLCASGTSSLAAAFYGVPTIVIYKINPLTFYLAMWFVVKVNYISIPNILLDEPIIPELLQEQATARGIFQTASDLMTNRSLYLATHHALLKSVKPLTRKKVYENILKQVRSFLK